MHLHHLLRPCLAIAVIAITGRSLHAQTIHTWNAGSGLWDNAANWAGGVPSGPGADVRIDGGVTGTGSIVQMPSLGGVVTVGKLQIDSGDQLLVDPTQELRLSASGFTGAGVMTVNGLLSLPGTTLQTALTLGDTAAPVTLIGTGSIQLGGIGSQPEIRGTEVTNQATLSGSFVLGLVGGSSTATPKMHNEGMMLANIAGAHIVLHANRDNNASGAATDAQASFNTGLIKASAGSTVFIGSGSWNNTDGDILAEGTGAKVGMHGTNIEGGIIEAKNGGLIEIGGAGITNWKNLTIKGPVTVAQDMDIDGTITNTGSITLLDGNDRIRQSEPAASNGGTVTLDGPGTIFLARVPDNNAHLGGTRGHLFNKSNTIRGRGNLGVWNGSDCMDLTNRGLIMADLGAQGLNVSARVLTNESGGRLRAEEGGTLNLNVETLTNIGGFIEAESGGRVQANAVRVVGGMVRNLGGQIALNNWTLVNPTADINGMRTQGTLTLENNQTMRLVNTIKNEGIIHARSTGDSTRILLGESGARTVTLVGDGSIRLGDPDSSSEGSRLGTDDSELTHLINADQTIHGFGLVGRADDAEYLQITNQDVIKADASGKTLRVWSRSIDNTAGQLFAENGGILALYATNGINNANSTIEAKAGSTVTVESPTRITGGTLAGNAGDTLPSNDAGFFIGSATLVSPIIEGIVSLPDNRTARLVGTQTINGTLRTNSTASRTDLIIGEAGNPNVTLNGTGQLDLGDTGGDSWRREDTTGVTLTVNIPVHGFGNFGDYDRREMTLVNNTTITGNSPGKYMSFHPNELTNSPGKLIVATNGGNVWMNVPTIHNNGAELRAESGSTLGLGGSYAQNRVVHGGTLRTMAGGTLKLSEGITARDGLAIENDGEFEVGDDSERHLYGLDNGGSVLRNRGKIQKFGFGVFHLQTALEHTGEIETFSGILRLYGGGTITGAKITSILGADTGFHGPQPYTFTGENTLTGDGGHFTDGGTLVLADAATKINAQNFDFAGASGVSGQGEMNIAGQLRFDPYSNTTLHNVKLLNAEGSFALVNRQGYGVHFTGNARWENRGTVTVQDSSNINGDNTTEFVTTSTGKVLFTDDSTMSIASIIHSLGEWKIDTSTPRRVTLSKGGSFENAKMWVTNLTSDWFFTGAPAFWFSGQANEFNGGGFVTLNDATIALNGIDDGNPANDPVIAAGTSIVRIQGTSSRIQGSGKVSASFGFHSGSLEVDKTLLVDYGIGGGTLWLANGSQLSFTNGARFENHSRFIIQGNSGTIVGEPGTLFHNMAGGTIVHDTDSTTNFNIDFQNDGEVEFAAGEFYFLKSSTGRGGITASNGAKASLDYSQAPPDSRPKWVRATGTGSLLEGSLPAGLTEGLAVEAKDGAIARMIGPDGATIVAAGAGNVLAKNGGGMVAAGGLNLQSNGRAGIVAAGAGNVIVNNGGNVIVNNGGNAISSGANSLLQANGRIVAAGAGNVIVNNSGQIVAAGAGNMVAAGAGNLLPPSGSGFAPSAFKAASLAGFDAEANVPAPSSPPPPSLDEETGVIGLDAIVAKVEALSADPNAGVIFVDTGSQARAEGGGSIVAEADGILAGAGTFVGPGRIESGGTLMPGSYVGALTWTGNLDIQNGGKLDIEIGGTAAGQFDAINVSGSLIMEGQLQVHFVNNFQNTIQATDVFHIATAGSAITGTIDNLSAGRVTTSDGLGSFAVQFTNEGKTLTLTDYQSAGPTFSNWAAEKGLTGDDALPTADPDKDGLPNLIEYALGLDPKAASGNPAQPGTAEVAGQHYLTLTYVRPAGANARSDVTYTGERSTSLSALDWSAAGMVLHSVTPSLDGLTETVILRSNVPIGTPGVPGEFLRLKVSM